MRTIIIGNGPAAVAAVESIRRTDGEAEIFIISKENEAAYTPCFLAKYLCGEISRKELFLRPDDWYERYQVKLFKGVSVTEIRPEQHKVFLSNDEALNYDKLMIAAGANSIVPDIEGLQTGGVAYFRTLADAELLKSRLKGMKNAVVIGSGFIALEVAEALHKSGVEVTVVARKDRIMRRMLDKELSGILMDHLLAKGMKIVTGREVKGIDRGSLRSSVSGVELDNGEKISCDTVVVAIGLHPNLEMIKDASIGTRLGILVNDRMETNLPDVYAVGDIAEIEIGGEAKVNPVHINAVKGGEIAGSNITGREARLDEHIEDMNLITLYGLPVLSLGTQEGEKVLKRSDESGLLKIYEGGDGTIKGVQMTKDTTKGGLFLSLMKRHISIEGLDILSPRFNYGMTIGLR